MPVDCFFLWSVFLGTTFHVKVARAVSKKRIRGHIHQRHASAFLGLGLPFPGPDIPAFSVTEIADPDLVLVNIFGPYLLPGAVDPQLVPPQRSPAYGCGKVLESVKRILVLGALGMGDGEQKQTQEGESDTMAH